jgi:DNA replication protein DnaC
MQNEIMEARQVQQFNAQLHKDLAREQAARKRLHNEMEDLKGRIRVYVRVRPFSRSEVEKSSTEAVYKDGKLSVVVKTDETKKTFDFDQVFGGSSSQGNSQEDIFRDTKHLVMSVVDGYNVCIFAYGQTGSGKTFTMIGAADIGSCLQENGEFDELAGITPRAVSELFRLLNERSAQLTYVVCSTT